MTQLVTFMGCAVGAATWLICTDKAHNYGNFGNHGNFGNFPVSPEFRLRIRAIACYSV
jgi:hypothetical protein